jgi:hypothetical protein
MAIGHAKNNAKFDIVSNKSTQSSIFPLNTRYFQLSINHINISHIIDQTILSFALVNSSSLPLDINIFIQDTIIINVAAHIIPTSKNQIIS